MYLLFYENTTFLTTLTKVSFIVEACGELYERGIGTTPDWFAYYVDMAEKNKNTIVNAFGKYSIMYLSPSEVIE